MIEAVGSVGRHSNEDSPEFVAGSFRDRAGRVFLQNEQVYRAINDQALADWNFAAERNFVQKGMTDHRIVPTRVEDADNWQSRLPEWPAVLHHERLPLISYPYEWCFSMLRDAALLQLELLRDALAEDAIFKDATPYNIQFKGVQPTFIDTASIVPVKPGEIWSGYRQFCQTFLYPLMLQAYKGVDFQPFLRGRLEGITPDQFNLLLSFRDKLRKGVLAHVVLHASLNPRSEGSNEERVSDSLRESGFGKELIQKNVSGLIKLVQALKWKTSKSQWSHYDAEAEPVRLDSEAKEQFVRNVVESREWKQTWDVGCNLGRYSRIAASRSQQVIALDADHLTVDRLFNALKEERCERITPLVYNPADPSPNLGWRCNERVRLAERGEPDLILFLAVVHHLVIGRNLLLPDLMAWLAEQKSAVIFEYVGRSDPQLKSLLANREDVFRDYSRDVLQSCLDRHFKVEREKNLPSGTRTLFYLTPR